MLCFGTLVRLFYTLRSLLLENLALRQQLVVLKCAIRVVPCQYPVQIEIIEVTEGRCQCSPYYVHCFPFRHG
jgi:hypothetical protein